MNEESLFDAASALPPGSDRNALLDRECGDDDALRRRLEQLLAAHDTGTGILDRDGAAERTVIRPPEPEADSAGPRVGTIVAGRYKLLEQIGEGGMGTVWVAEQTEPVRRKVALKLIKAGMDSRSVIARFEAERQALALMDHPNIACVLDGGMTSQGRPYFVMEYVKGIPLTQYCDDARLTVEERLQLFIQVCQAVQHAHQKGIIHRDVKPTNILVCLYDGKPVPKVIDFGLAKAMHQSLTEYTLYTAHGVMLGTPLYMSPEQAELNNLDIDTRTDIYALGVVLYELLTGTTPLEKQQFQQVAWQEMVRLIKEVEPPRPSLRLSGSGSLPSVAAQRRVEPVRLSRLLRRDLDWIVMKALEKDRGRRYETANGFARDIERYLRDESVEATPPTVRYRLTKWAHRYRKVLVVGSICLLAITAGVAGMARGYLIASDAARIAQEDRDAALAAEKVAKDHAAKAEAERKHAELNAAEAETLADLFEILVKSSNSRVSTSTSPEWHQQSVEETLEQIERLIPTRFQGLPLAEARFRHFLGEYYLERGSPGKARLHFERAVLLFQESGATATEQRIASSRRLARLYAFYVDREQGLSTMQSLIAESNEAFGEDAALTQSLRRDLAVLHNDLGMFAVGTELLDQQLKAIGQIHSVSSPEYFQAAWDLAEARERSDEHALAIAILEQLLRNYPPANMGADLKLPSRWDLERRLAANYSLGGDSRRALDVLQPVYDRLRQSTAEKPAWLRSDLQCLAAIAAICEDLHDEPSAEDGWTSLLKLCDAAGVRDQTVFWAHYHLARLKCAAGDYAAAREYGARSRNAIWDRAPGLGNDWLTASTDLLFAEILLKEQRFSEAMPILQGAYSAALAAQDFSYVDWRGRRLPESDQPLWRALDGMAQVYRQSRQLPAGTEVQDRLASFLITTTADYPAATSILRGVAESEAENPWFTYRLLQAELLAGDRKQFRSDLEKMMARFAQNQHPDTAARTLYSCLHVNDAFDEPERWLLLGTIAAKGDGNGRLLGACMVRCGDPAPAIPLLEKGQGRPWDHLFLAIAHQSLGHSEKAREYFKRAKSQMERSTFPWDEDLANRMLRDECEGLFEPPETN